MWHQSMKTFLVFGSVHFLNMGNTLIFVWAQFAINQQSECSLWNSTAKAGGGGEKWCALKAASSRPRSSEKFSLKRGCLWFDLLTSATGHRVCRGSGANRMSAARTAPPRRREKCQGSDQQGQYNLRVRKSANDNNSSVNQPIMC